MWGGQKKDSGINQSPNWSPNFCFPAHRPGRRLRPTVAEWQLHNRSHRRWQQSAVLLRLGCPCVWHSVPTSHGLAPHGCVLRRSRRREGRCSRMFSVWMRVPLKRHDGHWAGGEIASVSFSTSNYFSEKGALEYVVQNQLSGIHSPCLRALQISFWTCLF